MDQQYDRPWLEKKYGSGDQLKFLHFWGHTNNHNQKLGNFIFSQWFPAPFQLLGVKFKSAEHWMMAQKALLFKDEKSFHKIVSSESPKEAKLLGRQVLGFDQLVWEKCRYSIVVRGNILKFNLNKEMGEYLLQTGSRILVEASPVDLVWGSGLTKESDDADNVFCWRGLNLLGFALMQVRDFLTEVGFFSLEGISLKMPWLEYAEIDPSDMFWRMGKGEEHLLDFQKAFKKLDRRDATIIRTLFPEPTGWEGLYG